MLRVIGAFEEVEHVQLAGEFRDPSRNEVVFVQDEIGVAGAISVRR
jgi:hypothetical protein